jgi:hypothetical protein
MHITHAAPGKALHSRPAPVQAYQQPYGLDMKSSDYRIDYFVLITHYLLLIAALNPAQLHEISLCCAR